MKKTFTFMLVFMLASTSFAKKNPLVGVWQQVRQVENGFVTLTGFKGDYELKTDNGSAKLTLGADQFRIQNSELNWIDILTLRCSYYVPERKDFSTSFGRSK